MKKIALAAIVTTLLLSACATGSSQSVAAGSAAGTSSRDVVTTVSHNLSAGVSLQTANQNQLTKAVKRTVRMHPEMKGEIVPALTEVVPGKKTMVKKAYSLSTSAYARTSGNGKSGAPK